MQKKKIIVIDTNPILKCPQVIDLAISAFDKVFIPKVVISEINYQKDNGSSENRKLAGLCLGKIIDNKSNIIRSESNYYGRNDDKIYHIAEDLAECNLNNVIYLLTNDKDFRLKGRKELPNLYIINSNDFLKLINNDSRFDSDLSKRFYWLVNSGDIDAVKSLVLDNIDVNFIDGETGYTPLIQAVRNKNYEMIRLLLSLDNVDINAVDKQKYCFPPISHAIQIHNTKIVKLLIDSGANVNAPSKNETNYFNMPLMIASWSGELDVVTLLVDAGAYINQVDRKNGFTALMKATIKNDKQIVKFLLESGADRDILSFDNKTALDYAIDSGNEEIIDLLRKGL